MEGTPRLFRYLKLGMRTLGPEGLWVAIVRGAPATGGTGVVVHGEAGPIYVGAGRVIEPPMVAGATFHFSANQRYDRDGAPAGNVNREIWGLDAVPDHVAAAWLKLHHQGKLTDV